MKNNSTKIFPVKRTVGSIIRRANVAKEDKQSCHNLTPVNNRANIDNKINNDNKAKNTSEPVCDICAQNVPGPEREKIYAYGKCEHHVCYVCSARLRAICDQQECPICREKLENVIFSANKTKPFDDHDFKGYQYDDKYRIYFENDKIKAAFENLLLFECLICSRNNNQSEVTNEEESKSTEKGSELKKNQVASKCAGKGHGFHFPNVQKLKSHLETKHKLKLCDLCLTHNKLFPFEYSYYDHESLRKHIQFGEENTSHRGHPKCKLCSNFFFNVDELIQHMSREHFHCHLCGRHNTTQHIYFMDYPSLRNHFKTNHYLCERENCRHEQFTSAFDTQVDFQLHLLQVHEISTNLSRGEARQQRTIMLESAPHRQSQSSRQDALPLNAAIVTTGVLATANDPNRVIPEAIRAQIRQQRLPSGADFPALSNSSRSCHASQDVSQLVAPLGQAGASYSAVPGTSSSFVRSMGGSGRRPEQLNEMDFPPLPEQPKKKAGNKPKASTSKPMARCDRPEELTLDQLINASLNISARNNKVNKSSKASKSTKHRPIKIQL